MLKILVVLLLIVSNVHAADVAVQDLIVSTPSYKTDTSDFKPELGQYEYEVSWAGIPAATIYLDVNRVGLRYNIQTRVETYSAIDIFYKLRYKAKGLISAVDFSPIEASIDQRENSKHKVTALQFYPDGRVRSFHNDKRRGIKELDFNPNNQMLDPFSAAFLARSLDWEPGVTRHFDTFNGKSRYLISFKAIDKIQMEVNDQMRDVWVVEPKVKKLNTDKLNDKLRSAKIYVTADEKREILQIKSEVFIGNVKTRLDSFKPSLKATRTLARKYDF